jgi:pilus assembly protein Flp/PilA
MKKVLAGKRGQGMTEYILIIALIAILVLGAVKIFGGKIKDAFTKASSKVDNVTQGMDQ